MASLQSEKVSEKIPDVGINQQKKQESYILSEPQQLKHQEEQVKNAAEDHDCNRDTNGDAIHKKEEACPPPPAAAVRESPSFSEKMKTKIGDDALIKKIEEIIHGHKAEHEMSAKPEEDAPNQSLVSKIKSLIEDNAFPQQIYGHRKGEAAEKKNEGAEKEKEKENEGAEKEKEKETTDPAGNVKSMSMAEKIKMKIGDNALIHKLEEIIRSHKDSSHDNSRSAEGAAGKQSLAAKVKNIIEDNAFIQNIYGRIKGGEKKQNGGEEGPKCTEEKIHGHQEEEVKHAKEDEQKKSMTIGEKIKREVERNPLLQKIDGMIHGPKDAKMKPDGEKKGDDKEGVHKEEEKKSEHEHEHEHGAQYEKQAVPLS